MTTKTKTKTTYGVIDTTALSFHGYYEEEFITLADAFAFVAGELESGCDQAQFEIRVPGSEQTINIDARYVDFDEDEED